MSHIVQTNSDKFDEATLLLSQVRAQLACFSVFLVGKEEGMAPNAQLMGEAMAGMEQTVIRSLDLLT